MEKKGLVHIYTGNGKGKTTTALGLALRANGCELKVIVIQFMKFEECCEHTTLKKLDIEYRLFGREGFVNKNNLTEEDKKLAEDGLKFAEDSIHSEEYDIVILDEILMALNFGLLNEDSLIDLLRNKSEKLEIILTGRGASQKIIEIADIVTEMKEIKHPYKKGIRARKGIDF